MSEAKIVSVWVDRNLSAYTFDEPKNDHNFPGSREGWADRPLKVAEIVCRDPTVELVDKPFVVHGVTRMVKCLKIEFRPELYTGTTPYSITLTPFMALMAAEECMYGLFLSRYTPTVDMYNSFHHEAIV